MLFKKLILLALAFAMPFFANADDYFWVGGSGNWSDINHWATTSGGTVYHTQLPGSTDDVFFDSNSGLNSSDTVFFTVQTNYAHDFEVSIPTAVPTFYGGPTNVLRIYGSCDVSTLVRWELKGTLYFESSSAGETIAFSDTLKEVYFNASGNWSGSDTLYAANITVGSGTFSLSSGQLLQADTLDVLSGASLSLNGSTLLTGYTEISSGATFTPNGAAVLLQRPIGQWYQPYFYYFPTDSIYLSRLEVLSGSGRASVYNATIDSVLAPSSFDLDIYDSEITYFSAGYPNLDATRSYILNGIDAPYLNVRLYDHSTVPYIQSAGWAYVCLNQQSSTDSVIVSGNLEIGGQNNIKIPLVRAQTLNVRYVCSGGTLVLGSVYSAGNVDLGIPVEMDTLEMGYPAVLRVRHTGANTIDHFISEATCDSVNYVESNLSYTKRTLDISSGSVSNTHFRDIANANGPLIILSGNPIRSTGITSTGTADQTYYWVGGSGSWTDLNHWSSTSGGTANAACIPGLGDTVIVDDNSATGNWSIQLNLDVTEVSAFRDLTTTLEPYFGAQYNDIFRVTDEFHNVRGSFYSGLNIVLEGSSANATLYSLKQLGKLYLSSNGTWTQLDTVRTASFYFHKGVYDQGEKPLYVTSQMRNDQEEHNQYVNGSVNWNLENTEAHVRQIRFGGGNYITHPAKSTLYLSATWHRNNDSLDFNTIITDQGYNKLELSDGTWHANSLDNHYDLRLGGNANLNVDSLTMHAPATISSSNYNTDDYRIGQFFPNSDCGQRITFDGTLEWHPTKGAQTIYFGNFSQVNVMKDSIIAISSTDLGGNTNIAFTPDLTRTLYWVNDGGNWNDSTHWSLSSGGLGGECLPTPVDSVVFDHNSFKTTHNVVINGTHAYAHDIIIDSSGWANFSGGKNTYFYGSLIVHDSIYVNPYQNDWIGQTSSIDSVYLKAGRLGDFTLTGTNWRLPTDLHFGNTFRNNADSTYLDSGLTLWTNDNHIQNSGGLYTQYDSIDTRYFYNFGNWIDSSSRVDIAYQFYTSGNTSHYNTRVISEYDIQLNGNDSLYNGYYYAKRDMELGNTTYLQGDSLIGRREYQIGGTYSDSNTFHYLWHDKFWYPQNGDYVRLYHQTSDTVGHMRVEGFNNVDYYHYGSGPFHQLHLMDNTLLYNAPQADSLTFYAGNTYEIDDGQTLTVNQHLQSQGTFCDYIYIRSDAQGTRSYIDADFQIFTNFCEYRDIEYTGNNSYFAGAQSTDQGNNQNLLWDNISGYIWGFPSDTLVFFCNDSSVYSEFILGTETFQNAVGYLWDDGSDSTHRIITQSGLYSVTALYETCSYTDSIQVNFIYKPELDASEYNVCTGTTLSVFSQTPPGLRVKWSNQATTDTTSYLILSDTILIAQWFQGANFLCQDSIFIDVVEITSATNVFNNPSCFNTSDGTLSIQNISGGYGPYDYLWAHNTTLNSASDTNLAAGCYPVTISDTLGCSFTDTICLTEPSELVPTFTTFDPFCHNEAGSVSFSGQGGTPGYSYSFSGYDTAAIFDGTYAFTITDTNGCTADTTFEISHTFDFNYSVDIDTATCGSANGGITIIPGDLNPAYTYSWSAYPGYFNNGQIFMGPSNGFIYLVDSIAGCTDTVYYEIPSAGITNAVFTTDLDSGISPLTITTQNANTDPFIQNLWIINGDTISSAIDTAFTFPQHGEYTITHCVFDPIWGCSFCFSRVITVLPNPDIAVPNFFTPNFDGFNDNFELAIGQDLEELSIEVYTRWGNLVYQSQAIDFAWDGRAPNGLMVADGVYFWTLTYREVNAQTFKTLQGTVTVMDAR